MISNRRKDRLSCTFCGREGHDESRCWDKHGRASVKTSRHRSHRHQPRGVLSAIKDLEVEASDSELVCLVASQALSARVQHPPSTISWVIDSAATSHMTYGRSIFHSYSKVEPFSVEMGDLSTAQAIGYGDVELNVLIYGRSEPRLLKNVLHVPSFKYSLISVRALAKRGSVSMFDEKRCQMSKEGRTMATGSLKNDLYVLDTAEPNEKACFSLLQLWHERMAHVNAPGILSMLRNKALTGLDPKIHEQNINVCEGCVLGKMTRSVIPKQSTSRSKRLLELVHTDIAEFPVRSKGGAKYFETFIDDFSRYVTCFALQTKSECFSKFIAFKCRSENELNTKILKIRSDGGGEYWSNEFCNFLKAEGMHHESSCSYTPHQNGVPERMNRTLKDLIREMLTHRSVPNIFWAEALQTASYIRNRVTNSWVRAHITPFELWT